MMYVTYESKWSATIKIKCQALYIMIIFSVFLHIAKLNVGPFPNLFDSWKWNFNSCYIDLLSQGWLQSFLVSLASFESHCLPPFWGTGLSHFLSRVTIAPPHVLLQGVQVAQAPQPPSTERKIQTENCIVMAEGWQYSDHKELIVHNAHRKLKWHFVYTYLLGEIQPGKPATPHEVIKHGHVKSLLPFILRSKRFRGVLGVFFAVWPHGNYRQTAKNTQSPT